MIEKYGTIYKEYNEFIINNSEYNPYIAKNYTNTSSSFPFISCQLSNMIDTDFCTIDMIERHNEMYLTFDIYTKDKSINNKKVASQVINDELTELTLKFLGAIGMKVTLCRLTPNADTSITRRTIQCQGLVSNTRGNIIRR